MNTGFVYNPTDCIKNFSSLRVLCLWAGGLGLIQSLIWIGLTIAGILSYACVIKVDGSFNYGSLFPTVFLQLYFMGTCDSSIPNYDDSMLRQIKTVLNPEDFAIWNCVYLAVAICWLLASVLLMSNLKQDQPRMVKGLLWSWIFITLGICAMDLALGVIFGIDYGRFNRKAYMYNLSNIYSAEVNPNAAQLLAGMVVSMTMLIISLKGFVLWLVNFCFLFYLSMRAIFIGQDNNGTSNVFLAREESDDILSTRPPINAYHEEEQKPTVLSTIFSNGGYEPDNQVKENTAIINREIIARAARLSADVALHERRFRNLNNFQQYPPSSRPESTIHENTEQKQQPTSSSILAAFPAPDYTPPMQRAAQNPNRNERFQ